MTVAGWNGPDAAGLVQNSGLLLSGRYGIAANMDGSALFRFPPYANHRTRKAV